MSWIVIKNVLCKVWVFLKEYWQIPFLLIWSIAVWILARRNSQAITDVMNAKKESYRRQIEVLRDSHNEEIMVRDGLIEKYEEELRKLEEHFKEDKKELTEKHKSDLKEVIIETKLNPSKTRKRIEEEFGFNYVK